jgi:hypothetical protein
MSPSVSTYNSAAVLVSVVAVLVYAYVFVLNPTKLRSFDVHQSDEVLVIDNFLTPAECDEVIRLGTIA